MKGGKPKGYTIIETLVFLAVSTALFAMVALFIAGRQARAEFTYGVQEFSTRMADVMNDVSTGYYDNIGTFACNAGVSGAPVIDGTSTRPLGENTGCIFIGRVIQFDPDEPSLNMPEDQGYNVFSVVGRRVVAVPGAGNKRRDSQNFNDSYTVPLYDPGRVRPNNEIIPNGIRINWLRYATVENGALTTNVGAVGLFTNFGFNSTLNQASIRNVQVIPIPGSGLDQTTSQAAGYIENIRTAYNAGTLPVPRGGVVACLSSPNNQLFARITFGGNLRQQANDIEITGTPC